MSMPHWMCLAKQGRQGPLAAEAPAFEGVGFIAGRFDRLVGL